MIIKKDMVPDRAVVYELYSDVGWAAYTNDMDKLMRALKNSMRLLTIWDGEELIGLIRAVGDGETIIYIQDLLIKESHQRMGLGSKLIKELLNDYEDVRQIILLTEDKEDTRGFYSSNGFKDVGELNAVSFMKI